MSQPAPTPKQSLTQTLLFVVVLILGYQLFFANNSKGPTDARTSAEVLTKMREMNAKLLDVSIANENRTYHAKLDEEAKKLGLSAADLQKMKLEGDVLAADTAYKGGMRLNDTNRVNDAYMILQNQFRGLNSKPVWKEAYAVTPSKKVDTTSRSAEQLYDQIVKELDSRYHTELVWGLFPGYQLIDFLVNISGKNPNFSYALAALLLAVVVRAIVWPLNQRQLMWSRKMQMLAPLSAELKKSCTDKAGNLDQQQFQVKQMGLYREYGINPMLGCLPALAQMPFFLMIYQCMLHYRFEFKDGYFLWINPDLSAATNGFIGKSLGETDYILIVVYGVSMLISTLLAPVTDINNIRQQRIMGIVVALMVSGMMFLYPLPSAFVLYWIFTNVLSTLQSLRAYRLPAPPLEKVNAAGGGVFPFGATNGVHTSTNGQPSSLTQSTGTSQKKKSKPRK